MSLHRFTDFLVYEVGLDGQVVRLKDIQGPQRQKKEKPVAPPEAKEGEVKEAAAGGAAEPKEVSVDCSTTLCARRKADSRLLMRTAVDSRGRGHHGALGRH